MYNKNEKEVDFSDKIAMSKMTKEAPAKPDERKKGSKVNPPGSAGTKPDSKEKAEKVLKRKDEKQAVAKITFSEKTTQALKNKVAEHNKKYSRKVTLGQLKKVYRRGAGAFSASHRPGQSRNSWAMARVNMFLKMMRGGKVKDAYRKADRDIAKASDMTYDSQGEKKAPLNKPFRTPTLVTQTWKLNVTTQIAEKVFALVITVTILGQKQKLVIGRAACGNRKRVLHK